MMCTGKVRHRMVADAYKAAHKLWQKGEQDIHYYVCDYCGFWHVGHLRQEVSTNGIPVMPRTRQTPAMSSMIAP